MAGTNNKNSCSDKPCQTRASGRSDGRGDPPDEVNAELRGRPILYTGVVWIGVLRRFLIPRRDGCSPPTTPKPAHKPVTRSVSHVTAGAKPSNAEVLPPTLLSTKEEPPKRPSDQDNELRRRQKKDDGYSPLVAVVAQIKEASHQARKMSSDFGELVREGRATTSKTIQELRREDAVVFRYGAVSLSWLVGYLAGFRRGAVTRLVYSATGTAAMAVVCYPDEARHYNSQGLMLLREFIILTVNLVQSMYFAGPQRALGKGDPEWPTRGKADPTEKIIYKSQYPDNPFYTDKTGTPHKKEGTSHQNQEELKSNRVVPEPSMRPEQESPKEVDTKYYPIVPPKNSHSTRDPTPSSVGKLSMQCSPDVMKSLPTDSVPYSPGLPAPPKIKSTYNKYYSAISDNISNYPMDNTEQNKHSASEPVTKQKITQSENKTSATNSDLCFGMVPTPEPIVDEEQDTFTNENFSKTKNHPLNKKLSRYYNEDPEDDKNRDVKSAPPEKQFDELYSRRG